jgi:peroxiredoxin
MEKNILHVMRAMIIAGVLLLSLQFPTKGFGATVGKPAPDFQITDLSGTVRTLSDLRGSVVVLNFWATWCPECLTEIDSLSSFTDKYGKRGVVVLGISVDKNEASLREFLADHPVKYPVMIDKTGDVFARKYLIRGLPATIIIDRHGTVAAVMLGAQDFLSQEFTEKIEPLLGSKDGIGSP